MNAEPETLDWNRAHTPIETYVLMNLMEGLMGFDSKLHPKPSLAEKMTVSPDGRTYTFKLRPGVKWSDGVPLKAEDFRYSWERLLTAATGASYAYLLFDIVGAEDFYRGKNKDFSSVGIQAPNDSTFIVKLRKPIRYWDQIPTFWVTFPLRKDVVQKYGSQWINPGKMVTVGPYTLAEHDFDSKIILKANPYYYGTRGNVDKVVGQIVKDDSTALTLYEAGKLDFLTDISLIDVQRLEGRADLHSFPYLKTGYLGLVTDKGPTSNVHLRRALAMAIDRSRFAEILHGGESTATSFVPPPLLAYSKKIGLGYNPTQARRELEASGLGHPSIELVLPNGEKQSTLGQFIQSEIKKNLGLDVVLQNFDHKTFRAQLDLHLYSMFLLSWSADYPDPDNFLSLWLASSGNNKTSWKNPNYDDLVISARFLRSNAAREKNYAQAQKLLQEEDAVVVPLYYEPQQALVRKRVQGLELNPLNYLLLREVTLGD